MLKYVLIFGFSGPDVPELEDELTDSQSSSSDVSNDLVLSVDEDIAPFVQPASVDPLDHPRCDDTELWSEETSTADTDADDSLTDNSGTPHIDIICSCFPPPK